MEQERKQDWQSGHREERQVVVVVLEEWKREKEDLMKRFSLLSGVPVEKLKEN